MHQKAVPVIKINEIIYSIHDVRLCHAGLDRCVMALRRHYYWHTLSHDVKKYVKTCQNCQEGKSYHRYKALLGPLAIPNKFGKTLHIDHVGPVKPGPNREKYMFTIIDSYATWVWIFSVQNTTSELAAQCLFKVVSDAGAFKHLISDNATSFPGKVITQFCELFEYKRAIGLVPWCS